MKFTEMLEELKKGERVTREEWEKVKTYRYKYIKLEHGDCVAYLKDGSVRHKGEELTTWVGCVFGCADFTAEDWKIWDEKPTQVWKLNVGDKYYYISNTGSILYYMYDEDVTNKAIISIGNCFETKEDAQHMLQKIRIINQLQELSNNSFEGNTETKKWFVVYDCDCQKIGYNYMYTNKIAPFNIYFATQKDCENAVKEIGEDNLKKYYFDVED